MIQRSPAVASTGRAQSSPDAPGPGNHSAPAPDTEPLMSGTVKAAAPRRAQMAPSAGARETREPERNYERR